jgi:hypothetical protein
MAADWLEDVPRKVSNDVYCYAVTSQVISFVVVERQIIAVLKPHKARRLPRRDQTRPY